MIRTPYIDNYNRPFDDIACMFSWTHSIVVPTVDLITNLT